MKRIQTFGLIRDKMTGYWGERLYGQIEYLEEFCRVNSRPQYEELLDKAVAKAKELFDRDQGFNALNAKEVEGILMPASKELKETHIKAIGHAHIDMNWMWRFDETVSITIETFRTMLMLLKEYPTFTFGQSQASCYKIVEEYAPELLPEIKKYVKEGRWEVTASTWVEADKNMISGESLSRHLLYTREYLTDLLDLKPEDFVLDFEPDTFGHNINVPEVLNNGGIKYYYHCRGYNGEILYRWVGPTGASVVTFREPTWYNETINFRSFAHVPSFCAKYGMNQILHLFGVGDHGGGATRRDLERLLDMDTWPIFPSVGFGTYKEFYKAAEQAKLPEVKGELNYIFTGCYTTETRIKQGNRIGEAAMFESEALASAATLLTGLPYPRKKFEEAWEKVLFNHFHDILPGSGVTGTREYAMGQFQQAVATASQSKMRALRAIAANMNNASMVPDEDERDCISEGAGVGFGVETFAVTPVGTNRGLNRLYAIFNPTQYERSDLAELTVWDWNGNMKQIEVTDEEGNKVAYQLLDGQKQFYWGHEYFRLLVDVTVPGFGYRNVKVTPSEDYIEIPDFGSSRVNEDPAIVLENDYLRAEFDPDDFALFSLIDKKTGSELLYDKACFRYILEDDSKGMTAWVVGRYGKIVPIVEGAGMIADTREGMFMISHGELRDGFSYRVKVEHSLLKVNVSLGKNDRLLRIDMNCEWREIGSAGYGIPQLQYCIPLIEEAEEATFSVMNGRIDRKQVNDDVPALVYGVAPVNGSKVMLVSDSKYGFRNWQGEFSLTLIRSSYNPDTTPEIYDHKVQIGVGLVEDNYEKEADTFCHALLPITVGKTSGKLPAKGQLMEVKGAVVSAVKLAEDDSNDLIVHFFAVEDGIAAFKSMFDAKKANFCTIHEEKGEAADLNAIPVKNGKTYQLRIAF